MPHISNGTLYRRKGSDCWYIKFYLDSEPQRETSGTPDREEAIAFLRRRLAESRRGLFTEVDQRPRFEDLRALLLENYRFKRNRTNPNRHVDRLAEFFGNRRAEDITEDAIKEYSRKRLWRDHMTPATLRRELAVLKRMLRLASGRLPRVPLVDLPRVDNARQGFFEGAQGGVDPSICAWIDRVSRHCEAR